MATERSKQLVKELAQEKEEFEQLKAELLRRWGKKGFTMRNDKSPVRKKVRTKPPVVETGESSSPQSASAANKSGTQTLGEELVEEPVEEGGYVCLWIGCSVESTFATAEDLDRHQKACHVYDTGVYVPGSRAHEEYRRAWGWAPWPNDKGELDAPLDGI